MPFPLPYKGAAGCIIKRGKIIPTFLVTRNLFPTHLNEVYSRGFFKLKNDPTFPLNKPAGIGAKGVQEPYNLKAI